VPKNIPRTLEVLSSKVLLDKMFFSVKNKTKEIMRANIMYAKYKSIPIKSVNPCVINPTKIIPIEDSIPPV
jgi:hypothetical protein